MAASWNAFRYGLYTDREADSFDNAELGGGLGYLDVAVGGVQLGPATYLPRVQPLEIRNEFADDVSWSKGKHILKFGVDFARTTDLVNTLTNRYGSYTYLTPTTFALDYSGATAGAKNWSAYSARIRDAVDRLRHQGDRLLSRGPVARHRQADVDAGRAI